MYCLVLFSVGGCPSSSVAVEPSTGGGVQVCATIEGRKAIAVDPSTGGVQVCDVVVCIVGATEVSAKKTLPSSGVCMLKKKLTPRKKTSFAQNLLICENLCQFVRTCVNLYEPSVNLCRLCEIVLNLWTCEICEMVCVKSVNWFDLFQTSSLLTVKCVKPVQVSDFSNG